MGYAVRDLGGDSPPTAAYVCVTVLAECSRSSRTWRMTREATMNSRRMTIASATGAVAALGIAMLGVSPAHATNGTISLTFTGPSAAAINSAAELCVDVYDATEDRNYVDGQCGTAGVSTISFPIAPGSYKLAFWDSASTTHYKREWYDDADYDSAQTVTIGSGGSFTHTVELAELGTIAGDLPQNSTNTPLCAAVYDANTSGADGWAAADCPDTDGTPSTTWQVGVVPGTYKIRYFQQDGTGGELAPVWSGDTVSKASAPPLSVTAGGSVNVGLVGLPPSASAHGWLHGPTGSAPVGGVYLDVQDADGLTYETTVNPDGGYTIVGLHPSGSYKVAYNSDYHLPQWYNGKSSENAADPIPGLAAGTSVNLGTTTLAYDTSLTPNAPRNARVAAGNGAVQLAWDPPVDFESTAPITYTATSSDGRTCSTTGLNCTISGLTNDTEYSFTISAHNVIGTSSAANAGTAIPRGTNQNGPTVTSKLKRGKSATLAKATASGGLLKWQSKTPKICIVKGSSVKGVKAGKCKVQATSPRTAALNAFSSTYTITVKAK